MDNVIIINARSRAVYLETQLGLSRRQLSAAGGEKATYLYDVLGGWRHGVNEKGAAARTPSGETIERLARVLHVPAWWLLMPGADPASIPVPAITPKEKST